MDRCWRTPRVPTQFFSQMMQLLRIILCLDPMVDLRIEIPNLLNSTFVRCTFDARFKHFQRDRPVDSLSLNVIVYIDGRAVGLLSKWNWYWRWSMHWVHPEFGKIRFDVCWLRMTDIYCRPDLNQCQLVYLQSLLQIAHHLPTSEILWTCWQNLIW